MLQTVVSRSSPNSNRHPVATATSLRATIVAVPRDDRERCLQAGRDESVIKPIAAREYQALAKISAMDSAVAIKPNSGNAETTGRSPNHPLRRPQSQVYEGGVHVPGVIEWRSRLKPRKTSAAQLMDG